MSTRLREETAWAILQSLLVFEIRCSFITDGHDILSGVGAVVHEEKLNVPGVVDEEGLVARGHHVLGLLVGAVSDLFRVTPSVFARHFRRYLFSMR
jgi:hypothetical protein